MESVKKDGKTIEESNNHNRKIMINIPVYEFIFEKKLLIKEDMMILSNDFIQNPLK